MKGVIKLQSSHIKAYGLETNQPWVQVDGELLGPLPMEFSAIPHGLTLVHREMGK
jgi:diacylglycerol kinase family enzyme